MDHHTRMLFVALAMLPDDDQPPPARRRLSAGEYRSLTLRARRWANICLDAGEVAEAKHQLNEAARFSALADEIDNQRKAA